ncbi:DMT family transporter [Planctomycetota bacterium]
MGNTVLGVAVMLVATSTVNVGAVLQKKAVDGLPPFDSQSLTNSVRGVLATPLWLAGWVLMTVGLLLNMIALGLADMSIIQPLNGFGLCVLAVFSRVYLGEQLTPITLVGIASVILGVAAIGATIPDSRPFSGAEEIIACYTHSAALATLLVFVGVALLLWWAAGRLKRGAGIAYAFVSACSSVIGLTFSKGLFALFAILGVCATLQLGPAHLLLLLTITFSTLALMILQLALQKGEAVVVTPVFAASSVVLPLVMGVLVFAEDLEPLTVVASLFIVGGVVCLGLREAPGVSSQ